MNRELTEKVSEPAQKVHPGLAKEVWDEVLVRSGIDPQTITEYNVPNEPEEGENQGKNKALLRKKGS